MRRELLMPKLGLTMTEGALAEWMVAPGAAFKTGDGIFVVETDKVASEVPADHDGVLLEVLVPVGEMVQVGAVIGYVDDGVPGSADGAATPMSATPAKPSTAAGTPSPQALKAAISWYGNTRALATATGSRSLAATASVMPGSSNTPCRAKVFRF